MLRFLTAGESHGPALSAILEGMPAGVPVTEEIINRDLARRQVGYGRGGRMQIERDSARLLAGVRFGSSLGSPISLLIENRDWENWTEKMRQDAPSAEYVAPITTPRPGHADLAGMKKYGTSDLRNILERASARETAARVAVGAIARCLLRELGITVFSHVLRIGSVLAQPDLSDLLALAAAAEASDLRCADNAAAAKMRSLIDDAKAAGDTQGGIFQVVVTGLPMGLGSHVHWDRRLDGILASAVLSIPAIKGVEFGMGFGVAELPGSQVHDAMYPGTARITRKTNNAGGLEGGMTNGEPLLLQAVMKPISTLVKPLPTVDLATGEAVAAHSERSDVCAVAAAGVVAEAMVAYTLAAQIIAQYGGDQLAEIIARVEVAQK